LVQTSCHDGSISMQAAHHTALDTNCCNVNHLEHATNVTHGGSNGTAALGVLSSRHPCRDLSTEQTYRNSCKLSVASGPGGGWCRALYGLQKKWNIGSNN
jgi:hypothetical protein